MTLLHAGRPDDNDSFIDSDIGYSNPKAQRRGHKILIAFMLLAGIAALVGGLLQGAQQIAAAFPNAQALLEGPAWMAFFAGLGQMGTVGLIVTAIALVWRWRIRRSRRRA
jgi:hypothetical protein